MKYFSIIFLVVCSLFTFNFNTFADSPPLDITIWCEAPPANSIIKFGGSSTDFIDAPYYFTILSNFIKSRNISRLIMRLEDPGILNPNNPPEFPSNMYFIGGNDLEPESNTLVYNLLCNQTLIDYNNSRIANGLPPFEIYVMPLINSKYTFNYPILGLSSSDLPTYVSQTDWNKLNRMQKSVIWVQMANEHGRSLNPNSLLISGIMFEKEGAGSWEFNLGMTALREACGQILRDPTPTYSNDGNSQFKLTTTGFTFDCNDNGSGIYLHEVYPELYNLTPQNGSTIYVDATSKVSGWSTPNIMPLKAFYGESIYHICSTDPSAGMTNDQALQQLANTFTGKSTGDVTSCLYPVTFWAAPTNAYVRPQNIHYMFSTEQTPPYVHGPPKPQPWYPDMYTRTNFTIVGDSSADTEELSTGSINAFGVIKKDNTYYTWDDMLAFFGYFLNNYAETTGNTYNNVALFDFNLFPQGWAADTPPPPDTPQQ